MKSRIEKYILDNYGVTPEFPWESIPDGEVFRRADNRKWFALFISAKPSTVGMDGDDPVDLLNVKCGPQMSGVLREEKGILPAYHMNKEHWISIMLDGSVPLSRIEELIDVSYMLTEPKRKKTALSAGRNKK